ncbi:MAG: hypothetical protein WC375_09305, partial [Methanomassiliicoccales archaeon]
PIERDGSGIAAMFSSTAISPTAPSGRGLDPKSTFLADCSFVFFMDEYWNFSIYGAFQIKLDFEMYLIHLQESRLIVPK